jgi:hypothetical protein
VGIDLHLALFLLQFGCSIWYLETSSTLDTPLDAYMCHLRTDLALFFMDRPPWRRIMENVGAPFHLHEEFIPLL